MAEVLEPGRQIAVCRELTKIHEEVVRGQAADLAERYRSSPPKGEVVLVVGPARPGEPDLAPALDAVRRLVEAGAKPRPAASPGGATTCVEDAGIAWDWDSRLEAD